MEGLTISNKKINLLERAFFGESDQEVIEEQTINEDIEVKKINTETTYNPEDESYTSWIDFEIKNRRNWQNEYSTVFTLPDSAYISDYYLYVGNEKKYGMLADKRAANWIYNQIKNVRKDPGLLTYIEGNKVSFKIFPFNRYETRKSGIQIVHKRPVTMNIDGNRIVLDSNDIQNGSNESSFDAMELKSGVRIIPKEVKEKLRFEEAIWRTPIGASTKRTTAPIRSNINYKKISKSWKESSTMRKEKCNVKRMLTFK